MTSLSQRTLQTQLIRQKLSQRQLLALDLLRMSIADLDAFVEQELKENAILDRNDFDLPHRAAVRLGTAHDLLANIPARRGWFETMDEQLRDLDLEQGVYTTARRILVSLDSDGFLEPLSQVSGLAKFHRALKVVQNLPPLGHGSVNAQECMLVQIDPTWKFSTDIEHLLTNHFDAVMELFCGRSFKLRQAFTVDQSVLAAIKGRILSLHRHPRRVVDTHFERSAKPDMRVKELACGQLLVTPVWQCWDNLRIDGNFVSQILSGAPEFRRFRSQLQRAEDVLDGIWRRTERVRRVAQFVVDRQADYILGKSRYLRPLTQAEVADHVGVDPGTISKAVSEKWIETSNALICLEYLFERCSNSRNEVDDQIRSIIAFENRAKPYSDGRLSEALSARSIKLSRRSVREYRVRLGIPAALERKRT